MAEDRGGTAWTLRASPVDELLLTGDGTALTGVRFSPHREVATSARVRAGWHRDDTDPVLVEAARQLSAYFAGELTRFDLPLAAAGSAFQRQVWTALAQLPYATTCGYGELAVRLGHPVSAARAVGLANGANPIPIVVPCHRVVGADGSLTGFGGGVARKRWLLDHEARHGGATLF